MLQANQKYIGNRIVHWGVLTPGYLTDGLYPNAITHVESFKDELADGSWKEKQDKNTLNATNVSSQLHGQAWVLACRLAKCYVSLADSTGGQLWTQAQRVFSF